jgi:serine/threonine protein phosphatase PrpC
MNVIRRFFQPSDSEDSTEPVTAGENRNGNYAGGLEGSTRPLAAEEMPTLAGQHLVYAQMSDVGIVRHTNQDTAISMYTTISSAENRPDFGIFIIADGMGGHQNGEKASAVAARTVFNEILRGVFVPQMSDEDERPTVPEVMEAAIMKANAEVLRQVAEGGTTLTAVVIVGDFAYIGHVGDSRAYLIHKGVPEQITRDHSYVQRLFELGEINQEQLEHHQQKNVLYMALGQPELRDIEVQTRRIPADSTLIICTDGLWGQVEDKAMLKVIAEQPDLQLACAELIATANMNGGVDNVSAILIRVPA